MFTFPPPSLLTAYFSFQTSLLSPITLPSDLTAHSHISLTQSPPSIPTQDRINAVGPAYPQDYMPLFTEHMRPSTASTPVMPPVVTLPPPSSHSLHCQAVATVPRSSSPAAVTHTCPSTASTSITAPSRSAFVLSPRSSRQDQGLPCISLPPQPQSFAMPRPIQPAGSSKKSRHVPIVPATPPHLILTGERP